LIIDDDIDDDDDEFSATLQVLAMTHMCHRSNNTFKTRVLVVMRVLSSKWDMSGSPNTAYMNYSIRITLENFWIKP